MPLHIKIVDVNVNLILSYSVVQVSLMLTVWVTPSVVSTVAQTSVWEEVRIQPISELKGIVQPFEVGGETRLIRSAVKQQVTGKF